ncbi:MAG TPA: hypothetical protein VHO03_09365 [Ignavibacteriales bacterium]|nr:hypothetical protein [Ignavibacteriales bacterium]
MEIKAVLRVDLPGDPDPRQSRIFFHELLEKNWQKTEEEKLLVVYGNILSYEDALETIKKELSEAASVSGILRYGALVHFIDSNMVVFFSGKNGEKGKSA